VKVTEADSSYTLPDSGAGQAVKNWFLEEYTVVREGYYSIEDTANDLLDNPKAHEIMKKHMPELTKLMIEKDIIPLGLTLKSILSRNPGEIDQKSLNEELNKVPVEY
jgi:beta-galactosidase